nr:hypothetical protein [Tanacetum cinerariifolium]
MAIAKILQRLVPQFIPGVSVNNVFGHIQEECPKNLGLCATKKLRKPSHATRGVPKKGVNLTKKVSNSNPLDVLNSAENDEELGTNDGTSNLLEMLIINGKVTLVDDDDGKPLKRLIIRVIMIGDSYENGDYDDIYEGHDFFDKIQDI